MQLAPATMEKFDLSGEYCDCKGTKVKPVADIQTGGHKGTVPAPKAPSLTRGGGETLGGGDTSMGAYAANTGRFIVALVIVATITIIVLLSIIMGKKNKSEGFFTEYAQEEPTRSYTPYTGTIPYGPWGDKPWAYAYDLERPADEYNYLPVGWRPTSMQLDPL